MYISLDPWVYLSCSHNFTIKVGNNITSPKQHHVPDGTYTSRVLLKVKLFFGKMCGRSCLALYFKLS